MQALRFEANRVLIVEQLDCRYLRDTHNTRAASAAPPREPLEDEICARPIEEFVTMREKVVRPAKLAAD